VNMTTHKTGDDFAEMARLAGPDIARLARLGAQGWEPMLERLAASGIPTASVQEAGTAFPNPFGVYQDADGNVVVDDYTNPISNIPEIVREFTRNNEGYWIEDVFNAPGWTVQGGAVRFAMNRIGQHFLQDGKRPGPRAPGAEAPILAGEHVRPELAFPENLSGRIEVTDEQRQDNAVLEVQRTFRQTANTFADILQDIGEAALDGLVTAESRFISLGDGTFAEWDESPVVNSTTAMPFPGREFTRVRTTFVKERGGVQPDTLVWNPDDAELFYNIYGDRAQAILSLHGFTRVVTSVRRPAGRRLYLRSGQVGTLAWAKPLGDPEYVREGKRLTDVYVLDGRFVFVANGADALLEVRDAS
jgi:hypothetical protein